MSLPHIGAYKAGVWVFGLLAATIITLNPTVQGGLIAAIPGAIAAILGVINHKKISRMEINVDGNLKRLLDSRDLETAKSAEAQNKLAHAEGRREGIESQGEKGNGKDK